MAYRVLIADDSLPLRLLVARALRLGAYDVLEAVDGDQALDMVVRERPDAIILDVVMPGRDGLDVCRAVRTDPRVRATPILVISANAGAVESRAVGADAFLTKPFLPSELLAAVHALVGARRRATERP